MNQETVNNTYSIEPRKRKEPSIDHNQPHTNVQQLPTGSNFTNGGGEPSVVRGPCVNCECGCAIKALDSLPTGFRFIPSDEELIRCYLEKKIKNEYIPKTKICEADIYLHHPKDIGAMYPQAIENAWFFFTPRNRKYPNGERPDRHAGTGYWKATGPDKIIKENGQKIGRRKSLVYHEGHAPHLIKTKWMMHEYVTEGNVRRARLNSEDNKLDDYVLCKIYINAKKKDEVDTDQQPPPVAFKRVRIKNKKALVPVIPVSNNHDDNLTTNGWVNNEQAMVPDQPAQQAPMVPDQLAQQAPMVPDQPAQQAPVVADQVKNDVTVQNYQNMRSPYDLMPLNYPMPHYSSLTNNDQYLMQRLYGTPMPQEPPTPPPSHESVPRDQVHAMMYLVGPGNPLPPLVAPPFNSASMFRQGIERTNALNGSGECDNASLIRECTECKNALNGSGDCDSASLFRPSIERTNGSDDCDTASLLRGYMERTNALNGNSDLFGNDYQFEFDGNDHLAVDNGGIVYEEPKVDESAVNREWWP